ncbi:hypothetical protein Ciccas_011600 [Cichlidogyrus casuarinus]|uniref:Acetyltransferase component of pyruvate dehydrogenase complex n=1 Tax=Cichlidogyrus casuarinus TaxID=1844966 RepID=A0ABD2PR78_9PLAT
METGTVISWAKSEGEKVSEGDLLAEIETDKATMSLDASEEGYIAKILIKAGTKNIPVGTPLCVVVEDSANVSAFKDFTPSTAPPKADSPPPKAAAPPPQPSPSPPPPTATPVTMTPMVSHSGKRVFASPLAKKMAKERGLDLTSLGVGSGLMGMITFADLANAKAGSGPSRTIQRSPDAIVDVPISGMRATIAKRLCESKQTIPHYYLTIDINLNSALNLRHQINAKLAAKKQDQKVSLNDFIIKAVSEACLKVPECNSSWMGDSIKQYNVVDVSVAVATPNGLITPIVKDAHLKGLVEISSNVKELASRAKANKLRPEEFQGGTFTISNLGMFGISNFSAIINPPQACILAVGGTKKQVVPREDDIKETGLEVSNMMSVTLCCDHRVVDGAVGAQWLAEFKQALEEPAMMLM